jgi:hypothetical protein
VKLVDHVRIVGTRAWSARAFANVPRRWAISRLHRGDRSRQVPPQA